MRRFSSLWAVLFALAPACAYEFWPGSTYDPRIPTFQQVLGYEPGARITSHAGVIRYLDALAAASPQVKVFEYGATWEGRKLIYAAIGSAANIEKLAAIRSGIARLADPRTTPEGDARKLISELPAVVWLGGGVHGDEISSPEALLLTAYHLLAARNDKMVDSILAQDLVLIDPMQNPDGHERFLNYYEQTRGAEPDANPLAAEHNQPWPGGRYNHYLFDLNRDWIALTQPEIRGEVKALREWLPLVSVDLHEMSGDSTYFFSPEADPYNPNLTAVQKNNLKLFGRNNARWFDKYGFEYFTREVYDAFYPGYGASWPSYYGALAMTYEQASARGLALRRSDETELGLRDTIRHHFVASLATLETAARNRAKLLQDFYRYRASAIDEGATEPVKEYILPRTRDGSATDRLVGILLEQGVEVKRAVEAFRSGDREYAAETYIVELAQPSKRLIRTLLDARTAMDERFVAAEATRRQMKQHSEIFDVTAWSLPLLFNVEAVPNPAVSAGRFQRVVSAPLTPGQLHASENAVAYIVPWGTEAAARLLTAALRQNLQVSTAERAFRQDSQTYPAGSLIFKTSQNRAELAQALTPLARETGADVYATDTGWVDDGANFGSRSVVPVRKPVVALAWSAPTMGPAAGATRFLLEQQYGYPVTLVRTAQLGSADLSRINVLILPPGNKYVDALRENGIDHLKEWVAGGGTLIALGDAMDFVSDGKVNLLDLTREDAAKDTDDDDKPERVPATEIKNDAQYREALRTAAESPAGLPGAILRAHVEPDSWLTAGVPARVNVMLTAPAIYSPIKADRGVNVVYFEPTESVLASGLLWNDVRRQIAYKPLVVTENSGRGVVVGFTADPNFRGMADGMNVLFLNAVFRGPAHARQIASER